MFEGFSGHMKPCLLAASALILGCSSVEPRVDARDVVTESTIVAERLIPPADGGAPTVRFDMPWRFENFGTETIILHTCPSGRVEVLDGTQWKTAWGGFQVCALVFAPITIAPGETREFTLQVSAPMNGERGGWQHEEIDGVYRYRVEFGLGGPERILRDAASNAFSLIESP